MSEHRKSAVQVAGLKLCFALMLGLLVVPAYVVAPILFAELGSAQAGLIAGKVFHLANLAVLLLVFTAAMFCWRLPDTSKATWRLLIAVAILVACNVFGVATMMAMIKSEAGDISALAEGDQMRWMFAFWHGLGSVLQLIATFLSVILVMKALCSRHSSHHKG